MGRRNGVGPRRGCGCSQRQPSPGPPGLSLSCRPTGRRLCRFGQRRDARSRTGPALGARQCREFRRRSGQCHDLWRVRWRRKGECVDGNACSAGVIPQSYHPERPGCVHALEGQVDQVCSCDTPTPWDHPKQSRHPPQCPCRATAGCARSRHALEPLLCPGAHGRRRGPSPRSLRPYSAGALDTHPAADRHDQG